MGPLRAGVTTPTKGLTHCANANDYTSPSVLFPQFQYPECPIHKGCIYWLAQC